MMMMMRRRRQMKTSTMMAKNNTNDGDSDDDDNDINRWNSLHQILIPTNTKSSSQLASSKKISEQKQIIPFHIFYFFKAYHQ